MIRRKIKSRMQQWRNQQSQKKPQPENWSHKKKTVLSSLSLTRYNFQDLSTRRRGGISKLKMEEEHRPNKDFDKTAEKRSETRNVF